MYTDKQLENIARGCLLVMALLDFAKERARAGGAAAELRFLGGGRDRYVLDLLHARQLPALKNFRRRVLAAETLRALAGEFACEGPGAKRGFWAGVGRAFEREYAAGRVNLFYIAWE